MRVVVGLILTLALSLVGTSCADEPVGGIAVQVVWLGSGDEPDGYAGFEVSVVPMVQVPSGDEGGTRLQRDRDAAPVTGITDATGFARLDASPAFPYFVRAHKLVPDTSGQCDWGGAESMESGGDQVTIEIAEACA